MMYVVTILCAVLALVSANSDCSCPNVDPELVEKLDDHGARIDRLVARAVRIKETIDRRKKEREEADKDSKNMLLRLDKLNLKEEVDKCPEKHFKCVTGGDSAGNPCVANILVCDGENDCLDGSDEDSNLCKFPAAPGEVWVGPQFHWRCSPFEAEKNTNISFIFYHYDESPLLKSRTKVESRCFWIDLVEGGGVKQSSAPVYGSYEFATRTARGSFDLHYVRTLMTYTFSGDDMFYVDSYLLPSMKHCHRGIMHKKTW